MTPTIAPRLLVAPAGIIAAGLIFGLRGNIERIHNKVFLLCPEHLVVGPEDKERLATGGFYNQS